MDIQNINWDPQWIQASVSFLTFLAALFIGVKQNEINEKVGKLQDVVELHGALLIIQSKDEGGKGINKEYICIQNIGTRIVYLQSYLFNGKKYKLNGHVLASTYSQTLANYYQIELPTNGENNVSLKIFYHDVGNRLWNTEILAEKVSGWGWKVTTFPKKYVKIEE
ncbi:MAG: hypothetical protein O3B87_01815 [bacterium]|nr:hypothetical protein [bacterium]